MFRFNSITFNHKDDSQTYNFSSHSFVYGMNTVGKTAMTKVIDFVLGSSENLHYQGLDNIDSVEAYLTNDATDLWVKRTIEDKFYYKRTKNSEYSEVSFETYKNNICLIITQETDSRFVTIYRKVFEETPTYRSFSFLNYIDEKNLGDLSVVFTRANELKHQIRIRNVMNFFFNFENIEQIYEKEIELEYQESEYNKLSKDYIEYNRAVRQIKKLFNELQLSYKNSFDKDYKTFLNFKDSYIRDSQQQSKDLVYLSKASYSLAEEIKIYSFMKDQSKNMIDRKERIKRLYNIIHSVIELNPEYKEYTDRIEKTIKEIDTENVILSLVDYQKSIKNISEEKKKIDEQISFIKGKTNKLVYEEAMKKVGLLEHLFTTINQSVDTERIKDLEKNITTIKTDIKNLKASFNKKNISSFNDNLTKLYLNSNLDIKHLNEDIQTENFSLEYDPFKLCLFATKKENDHIEKFLPGSMARQTHLQILVYLCLLNYLIENFKNFPVLPILIIDSANQPMGIDSFNKVYPTIINKAEEIGVQTIFLSKDKIDNVSDEDIIDISNGLNKFHKNK